MNSLTFFDVTAGATTGTIDLGLVAAATSDDTALRVFNASSAYEAIDVVVTIDGQHASDLYLSHDGESFTANLAIGHIPARSYSPTFWLRRVTDHFAQAATFSATLLATAHGWSTSDDTSSSDNIPLDTED